MYGSPLNQPQTPTEPQCITDSVIWSGKARSLSRTHFLRLDQG